MPNLTIQRLIYRICRTPDKKPRVNHALDRFGHRLNRLLDRLGIQKRYATGRTRNKAILFASSNAAEIQTAREDLLATDLSCKIAKNCGENARFAFNALPAALDEAKEIFTLDQILNLFGKIVEKCGRYAAPAFNALPLDKAKEIFIPDQIFDLFGKIVEKCGGYAWFVFKTLPAALETAKQILLTPEKILDFFGRIVEKTGGDAGFAFQAFESLFNNLSFTDIPSRDVALSRFIPMLESLTDYNRQRVLLFLSEKKELYRRIGPSYFLAHYTLYMEILTNYKRLGFSLLNGILEATWEGIIPKQLTPEETGKIRHFIDQTNSFSPIVYKVYRDKGDALLKELRPLAQRVLEDRLGKGEIEAIVSKYASYDGFEFLAAIIQMAIPLSGASFVKRDEAKGLLQKMIGAGDLRDHVPAALRGQSRSVALEGGAYTLREGETINLEAINPILEGLRAEKKAELPELKSTMGIYLRSNKSEEEKEKVRQVLYRYASRQDLLGEKIDRLGSTDYYILRLLEEIFRDKDCLTSILVRAIDELPSELLVTDKSRITHPEALARAINKMWKGQGSKDEKVKRLAAMTIKYHSEDLRMIIDGGKLDREISDALNELIQQETQVYISRQALAEDILKSPLWAIEQEKAKYEYQAAAEGIKLALRMIKGIPYGMWGLNAGVCIAADIELWKDPHFKLIAMIDEETGTAAGFIHVYEVEIKGKKIWTLPGIEPSTEFIGQVNAQELYDKVMEQVIEFAKLAGTSAVYLPTDPTVHSNRSDIQKAIKSKNYKTKTIPKVNWSRRPAYPFDEVFVVWEGV